MKIILTIALFLISLSSYSVEIASCYSPSGRVYYPEIGLITKKDAGWRNDKISGGIFKLSKLDNNEYDIIFVDATKKIISSTESGGTVIMLTRGKNSFSIMVIYPGQTAEIYNFLKNSSGKHEFIHLMSRSGDSAFITKASVMRGDCDPINFEKL